MSNRKRFGGLSCGHGPSTTSRHSIAFQILAHMLQMQHGSSLHLGSPPRAGYGCKAVSAAPAVEGTFVWKAAASSWLHRGMEVLFLFWSKLDFRWIFFRQKGGPVCCVHGWNRAAQDPVAFFWMDVVCEHRTGTVAWIKVWHELHEK